MKKRSWFPIFLVLILVGLLGLLAALQYHWLGQISRAEGERLERNLQTDTFRFSEDFNREIQNAYFNFQLKTEDLQAQNWNEFNERREFWLKRTAYPNLIKEFYLVQRNESAASLKFNTENRTFAPTEPTGELNEIKRSLADDRNFEPIVPDIPALLMPIYEEDPMRKRVLIRRTADKSENGQLPHVEMPKKYGAIYIKLNGDVIKNQIFPDLVKKYFSASENANYKLAVTDQAEQTIFQTQNLSASDASAKLFNIAPDNFLFYANKDVLATIEEGKSKVVTSRVETMSVMENLPQKQVKTERKNKQFELKVRGDDDNGGAPPPPRIRVFEGDGLSQNGIWTLNVQHEDGSLAQYVTNARRKNLAISFGILSLLAASIVLIFVSAQRAKRFAQRQMDFVSAVSHEFRTPLAVIYSAGENLSDGVIREESKISNYGDLIKREGKKLSAMVEQILEFAGARSGKRKFDFRQIEIENVIEQALAECQPAIEEKGSTVEKKIAKNLPILFADEKALTQAVQNLIQNALKYDKGEKWLKISAENGDGAIKISVEDKGVGIEKKEIGKIFEPFFRAKSVVDAQIHGNGLGLSLVKQIVESHKGEVKVESEAGRGSKFTIILSTKTQKIPSRH